MPGAWRPRDSRAPTASAASRAGARKGSKPVAASGRFPFASLVTSDDGVAQHRYGLGLAGQGSALARRADHPSAAGPWMVDDAYGAAAGAARPLCRTFGARFRPGRAHGAAAAVALAQSGPG